MSAKENFNSSGILTLRGNGAGDLTSGTGSWLPLLWLFARGRFSRLSTVFSSASTSAFIAIVSALDLFLKMILGRYC